MRLTKKYDDGSYGIEKCTNEHEKKLGQLEDIEDELGIDLGLLVKAGSIGIFYRDNNTGDIRLAYNIKIDFCEKMLIDVNLDENYEPLYLRFKDYGKTWALTKEELE